MSHSHVGVATHEEMSGGGGCEFSTYTDPKLSTLEKIGGFGILVAYRAY